jgi:transcriptional regulator with XRE-family HTH domain
MNYSEIFKKIRADLGGVSQAELAKTIGIASSAVSQWERGAYVPTKASLRKVIQVLALPQDYFVGCEPAPKPEKRKKNDEGPKHVILHHTPKSKNEFKFMRKLKEDYGLKCSNLKDMIVEKEKEIMELKGRMEMLNNFIGDMNKCMEEDPNADKS